MVVDDLGQGVLAMIADFSNGRGPHVFGGDSWRISCPAGAEPPAVLLVAVGLDDRLAKDGISEPLPLCSRVDVATPERQRYRYDVATRTVAYQGEAWRSPVDPEDAAALPERRFSLRRPAHDEDPERVPRAVVEETIFGDAFIRIGGRPVWLDDEVHEVCGCGRAMSYVALVGYNVTSDDAPRFFIGEMALYFLRCAPCAAMTVVFQST